ncbi:hypothetical protein NQ314_015843 [Rhamnusium bicolor]|uniref:Uncharacterized protein n=1 Tax=Rhamnusium bicolor TaxID=1586634 RepID=A0AAV8WXS4_9CUCU|nr:hypothetical protein NQ314_015843 [Rhamnusium bicolor]
MASKRFTPSLLNIPEEENYYAPEPKNEFSKPISRRSSIISLKRENSRRKTCTGCPGCEPQDFKSLSGKLPEFPSLAACQNCTIATNDSKQRSIRKWLEDIPIVKSSNDLSPNQDVILQSLNSVRSPKRIRSPTRSLPPSKIDSRDQERTPSPRPVSERGLHFGFYRQKHKIVSPMNVTYKQNSPPPTTQADFKILTHEIYYDTVPMEEKREITMNFPPPDMIHEAMAVDKSEEKVTTLTKKQMNAVINELTVHRNLIIPQIERPVTEKISPIIDYETDSLERSGRNRG